MNPSSLGHLSAPRLPRRWPSLSRASRHFFLQTGEPIRRPQPRHHQGTYLSFL